MILNYQTSWLVLPPRIAVANTTMPVESSIQVLDVPGIATFEGSVCRDSFAMHKWISLFEVEDIPNS